MKVEVGSLVRNPLHCCCLHCMPKFRLGSRLRNLCAGATWPTRALA